MTIRLLAGFVLAGALVAATPEASSAGQDPPFESVFRGGVEVVTGRITLTSRGQTVKSLKIDDFEIKQNGVRQPITVFEEFVVSPARKCYEIGFESSTPAAVRVRTVEIKVRGYSKRIRSTYTLADPTASGAGVPAKRSNGCQGLKTP